MSNNYSLLFLITILITACNSSQKDWQVASSMHTIEAYMEFINAHPDNEMINAAQDSIAKLEMDVIEVPFNVNLVGLFINLGGVNAISQGDGYVGNSRMVFEKPLKPNGRLRELLMGKNNRMIYLDEFKIIDGIIKTEDFGDFSIVLEGTDSDQYKLYATRKQIINLANFLNE